MILTSINFDACNLTLPNVTEWNRDAAKSYGALRNLTWQNVIWRNWTEFDQLEVTYSCRRNWT